MFAQVWLLADLDSSGCVQFQVDSDSEVTKGIAALMVEALSGCTPADVRKVEPLHSDVDRGARGAYHDLQGEGGRQGILPSEKDVIRGRHEHIGGVAAVVGRQWTPCVLRCAHWRTHSHTHTGTHARTERGERKGMDSRRRR